MRSVCVATSTPRNGMRFHGRFERRNLTFKEGWDDSKVIWQGGDGWEREKREWYTNKLGWLVLFCAGGEGDGSCWCSCCCCQKRSSRHWESRSRFNGWSESCGLSRYIDRCCDWERLISSETVRVSHNVITSYFLANPISSGIVEIGNSPHVHEFVSQNSYMIKIRATCATHCRSNHIRA